MAPSRDTVYIDPDVMTARELALRLKWNVSTIYRMPLPMLRKGRRGRSYYWPDVLKYLRANEPGSTSTSHGGRR